MSRPFEQLKDELGRRIGPLLPDVPAAEFEHLIELMAIMQYRHDALRSADAEIARSVSFPNAIQQ